MLIGLKVRSVSSSPLRLMLISKQRLPADMIVALLVVIIAILLFGAAAVRGLLSSAVKIGLALFAMAIVIGFAKSNMISMLHLSSTARILSMNSGLRLMPYHETSKNLKPVCST